jgi:hypothetical protein
MLLFVNPRRISRLHALIKPDTMFHLENGDETAQRTLKNFNVSKKKTQ